MSSHPRDDSSGLKPAFPSRKSDEFLEEELAARNICNRKHGCSVLLSVPEAFTAHICEHTVSYLGGHDLYIPSEVEHSKWYLEVQISPSRPSRNCTCLRLTPGLLQIISACISKHNDLIERCIQILGRWLQMGFCRQVPVEERCDVFEHVALLLARPLFRNEFFPACVQQMKLLVRSSFAWSQIEFARLATVLIGCTHCLYKRENGAPVEGNGSMLFLHLLHELFLRKCAENDQAWFFLKDAYREWISVPAFVKLWCDWISALAMRVCRIIYGPTEGTTHVIVSCGFNYPVLKIEASDEDVVIMFWKLLHLQGDIADCSDPKAHNQICEGLSKVLDIFCDVGRKLPPAERGQSHPRTPNPPNVACMLRLGHEWLFGTCVRHLQHADNTLFTPGVVRAVTSLCRMFSSPSRILVDTESLVKMYDLVLALLRQGVPDIVDAIVVSLSPLLLNDNPCTRTILPCLTNCCIEFLATTYKGSPKSEVVKCCGVGITSCELSLRALYPTSHATSDSETLLDALSTCKVLLAFAKAETSEKCCYRALWSIALAAYNSIPLDHNLSLKIISLMLESLPDCQKDWNCTGASIVMVESFFHWVSQSVIFQPNLAPTLQLVTNFLSMAPNICSIGLTQLQSRRSACTSLVLSTVICSALYDCLTIFPSVLQSSSNLSAVLGLTRSVLRECTPPTSGAPSPIQAAVQKLPSQRPTLSDTPMAPTISRSTAGDRGTTGGFGGLKPAEEKDHKHQAGPDRYNKKIQDDPAQLIDRCRESARSLTWCIATLVGNFPFALGAATFGNIVCEDRLINLSSEKSAEGEMGDRLAGKMRLFAFGDGSSSCSGTLSIFQAESESLHTLCRDESGRYAWKWELHSPISGASLHTCSNSMSIAKPLAVSLPKVTHPRKKPEGVCPLLQLLTQVEREDAQSGIEQSPNFFAVGVSEEARSPTVKDAHFISQQLQDSSETEFNEDNLQLQRKRCVGSFSHSPISSPTSLLAHMGALPSEFLFNMGFASLDGFSRFHSIGVNSKSWRSIVSLDKLYERETHKIGLIYVGRGHQTQKELLHNEKASPDFEHFTQAIGWFVDLEGKHLGFMGGLDPLGSTGKFAPYYANSTAEVLFHVPTMMPTNKQDPQQVHKKRHVGNDHVHIILTDDDYDYRTSTIISQFNDVHIVIRQNAHGLFSVRVHAKDSIEAFGPLQDHMLVRAEVLPFLVRATAVHANRKVRHTQVDYRQPQPTRLRMLEEIRNRYQPLGQAMPAKFLSDLSACAIQFVLQ